MPKSSETRIEIQIINCKMSDTASAAFVSDWAKGLTIASVTVNDEGMDNLLVFTFTDGSTLVIEYDWIYEFRIGGRVKLELE